MRNEAEPIPPGPLLEASKKLGAMEARRTRLLRLETELALMQEIELAKGGDAFNAAEKLRGIFKAKAAQIMAEAMAFAIGERDNNAATLAGGLDNFPRITGYPAKGA